MPATIQYVEADGVTPTDSVEDLGYIVGGQNFTAKRYGARNIAGRTFGGSPFTGAELRRVVMGPSTTGFDQLRIALDDSGMLSPPYELTATPSAPGAGGTFGATGTYFYKITATDAGGETDGSLEVSALLTATTQTVALAWTPPPGATNIKVWRSTTTETYGPTALRTTLAGGATGYTDTGGATVSGTIPTSNTTGDGSTPATFELGPIPVDPIPDGATVFFWVDLVVPSTAVPETEQAGSELAELT